MPLSPSTELIPKIKARVLDGSTQTGKLVATGGPDGGICFEWSWTEGKIKRTINYRREPRVLWSQVTGYELAERKTEQRFMGSGHSTVTTELIIKHATGQLSWTIPATPATVRSNLGPFLAAVDARV